MQTIKISVVVQWKLFSTITKAVMAAVMRDEELDLLHNAELKEAFDEFDKVFLSLHLCSLCICMCVFVFVCLYLYVKPQT